MAFNLTLAGFDCPLLDIGSLLPTDYGKCSIFGSNRPY
jgi:hypothetical protein